ncbi:hypothetical protein Cgig2_006344 [Carnegiea gigantea]|uniref:Uncharacterized protein n=1 Tax=Carnegiea gigantea TaxID=171969 RepID=A0A9Q1Q4L2_9CARY|nr:hypothetical protein Cgig2_006344 [Carnegiea gigantea]
MEALAALKASRPNSALTVREVQEDFHHIIDSGYFCSCTPIAVDTRDGIRLVFQVCFRVKSVVFFFSILHSHFSTPQVIFFYSRLNLSSLLAQLSLSALPLECVLRPVAPICSASRLCVTAWSSICSPLHLPVACDFLLPVWRVIWLRPLREIETGPVWIRSGLVRSGPTPDWSGPRSTVWQIFGRRSSRSGPGPMNTPTRDRLCDLTG